MHGRDEPAGAGLQAVGLGEIEDAVVALVPVLEALADLRLGGAGFEAEEGVGEVVADVVVLRREVVALGLALLADERGLLVRSGACGGGSGPCCRRTSSRPASGCTSPDGLADDLGAALGDGLAQGEARSAVDARS